LFEGAPFSSIRKHAEQGLLAHIAFLELGAPFLVLKFYMLETRGGNSSFKTNSVFKLPLGQNNQKQTYSTFYLISLCSLSPIDSKSLLVLKSGPPLIEVKQSQNVLKRQNLKTCICVLGGP
jgi:hypothetical protein